MARAIGIDLGTTNSCCALVENGKPRVITYRDGSRTIPSVFAIDKFGNKLVGEEAKRQAAENVGGTVAASKRLIGRTFGSKQIDKMQQVFTYELEEGESSEVLVKVAGQVFTLEQISAAILRRIKESAEEALGEEVDQAVITVPAYFNDRQRQAVRAAGKLAGLKVLRVLNEPTAAALAYGLGRDLSQRVAIYDLGGGTFDISIIDIKDRVFEVIATGGDTFLGGVDFDDRVMQWVLHEFAESTGHDVSYDRSAVTRVREASEVAKILLSTETTTRIHIPAIVTGDDGKPLDIDIELTRPQLETLTADLVDRSIVTCERILFEAGTDRKGVDEILLVGGQSRMPMVRTKVQKFIGKPPSQKVHPDEAVAIGAAIMAHSLAGKRDTTTADVTLLDVLPMPIGIRRSDGSMHVLFQKNQPLPDFKTRTLTTSRDDQKSIELRIYQGESKYVADNELLGTFRFRGLRSGEKGSVKIEVTFHIDSEGILNLTARDAQTGELVEARLSLSKDAEKPKKPRPPDKAPDKAAAAKPTPPKKPALPQEPPPKLSPAKPTSKPSPLAKATGAPPPDEQLAGEADPDGGVTPSPVPVPSPPPDPPPSGDRKKRVFPQRKADASPQAAVANRTSLFARLWGWFVGLFVRG